MALAIAGLAALLATSLPVVLAGMALVAVGTFLAQAIATGHVGRTAKRDKAAASGIYLASYYAGGLVGSFVLGQVFDRVGWTACVAVLVAALARGDRAGARADGAARSCRGRPAISATSSIHAANGIIHRTHATAFSIQPDQAGFNQGETTCGTQSNRSLAATHRAGVAGTGLRGIPQARPEPTPTAS